MTRRLTLQGHLALAAFAVAACSKNNNAGDDAAAEAATVDAAPEAEAADAARVEAAAPLATTPPVVRASPKLKPDPEICAAARAARARTSPAAENLEAKCLAAGGKL